MTMLSTDSSTKPLRKCRICGLEAWNEKDLEAFVKHKIGLYGRTTLCKKCRNDSRRGTVIEAEYRKKYSLKHPLKMRYKNMIARCYNPKTDKYDYYGGRGVIVCYEWKNDQQAFIDWARENGFKPKLTLDRIDNDGPYSPENCRWITQSEQLFNSRRTTTFLEKGTRICYKCKEEKPLSEFHKASRKQEYGYMRECKICNYRRVKEYRKRKRIEKGKH